MELDPRRQKVLHGSLVPGELPERRRNNRFSIHRYVLHADLVEERFPKLNGKVIINNIGTTIGAHTGPGTVALFFWGSERID